MFRSLIVALVLSVAGAFQAPIVPHSSKVAMSKVIMEEGKGFGGGEATRDPEPTSYDPNDPKGKQQAIHKAESFAEYLARRNGGGGDAIAVLSTLQGPEIFWGPDGVEQGYEESDIK